MKCEGCPIYEVEHELHYTHLAPRARVCKRYPCNLHESDVAIIKAMLEQGEDEQWSCLTCAHIGTCDAIKVANNLDMLVNPCRGWELRVTLDPKEAP